MIFLPKRYRKNAKAGAKNVSPLQHLRPSVFNWGSIAPTRI